MIEHKILVMSPNIDILVIIFVRKEGKIDSRICRWKNLLQWNLDLRKPDLRKNLNLRKIVGATDFLVHKLFDLGKIF